MPFSSAPVSAPAIAASNNYPNQQYDQQQHLLGLSNDLLSHPRSSYEQGFSSTSSPSVNSFAPTSAPYMSNYGNISQQSSDGERRQSSVSEANSHSSFGDAIDAGRGMVAMSQDLTTPRNIYGPRDRQSSAESYGFPSTHSSHSSISSASTYPSYYGGSVDSSVSEYSSQSDMESVSSRTLPRPTGLIGNMPPAPQSMMSQFNSKLSSTTQKKHKCKVCDKRFTRPSSLQTHMYSHTGEKRKWPP